MTSNNNWKDWLKFVIFLSCLILFLFGFLLGHLYNNYKNKSCIEDPIVYGIGKLNEVNSDKITCSCNSLSGRIKPFSFDENGIIKELKSFKYIKLLLLLVKNGR